MRGDELDEIGPEPRLVRGIVRDVEEYMGVTQSVSVGFFVRAERWRGDSFVVVSVGGGVTVEVASGTDAAMVDASDGA